MSIPSPETIARAELPNGIVVLARENQASPSVVVSGYLWAGSISELPVQAGLASLTSSMLMRGSERRTFGEINEALESVGARLGFFAGVHSTGFGAKGLAEDVDLLLEILADCLEHSVFPPAELEKLRGQVVTRLQRRAFDTEQMASLTFDSLLWPDHPYGRSVLGYEGTVAGLRREDVVDFHRRRYTPQGMTIAITGAVAPEAAIDKVRATLGGWEDSVGIAAHERPPRVGLDERRTGHVRVPGKTQSNIVIGWPGVARCDADYYKTQLTNTVLGVFGMMGRLGDTIREEQGLAYYAYSQLDAGLGQGSWSATAGVSPENVERAVEAIRQQVRRLREVPVPAEELADSQSYMTGSMPLRLETNEGVARALLDMERYGLGLDYLQRLPRLIDDVTVEDVQEMANKYLDPDVYALAVAGPDGPGQGE
ncbi:MAG TPA: pitrilysin family protein [Anaerolineae bacterium]|nr:pitrilysin family protein [Anaerolineae bacterium]